jgi:nucleotide-binding universal stress UspA family protein
MPDVIVCGVDVSEAARPVLDTARWLADGVGARLVAVHAVEEPTAEAQEFASIVRDRLGVGDHEVRVVEGSPAAALLTAIVTEGAGFLVVGSRGQGPLNAGVFGSVSREVTARARIPVVVVPPGIAEGSGADGAARSIVCGVDGSEHALTAVRVAGRLAHALGWRLVLVHALPGARATASYLGARATNPPWSSQPDARSNQADQIVHDALEVVDGLGPEAMGVVEDGAPWDVLEAVAGREDCPLLVVAARGRGAVRSAVFGSVATRLATGSRRAVVMVPAAATAPRPHASAVPHAAD